MCFPKKALKHEVLNKQVEYLLRFLMEAYPKGQLTTMVNEKFSEASTHYCEHQGLAKNANNEEGKAVFAIQPKGVDYINNLDATGEQKKMNRNLVIFTALNGAAAVVIAFGTVLTALVELGTKSRPFEVNVFIIGGTLVVALALTVWVLIYFSLVMRR